jgi:ATP-dependent exoDNAse (exonuclease V) alpha subunit
MISKAFMSRDFNTVRIAQKALSDIKLNTITMKDYQENGILKIRKSIDYGYAHTIHKSQGGTYDKVMIYYDTITGAKFDTDTQQ